MADKEITVADLRDLNYFWEEKGSVSCWCDYEKKLAALTKEHPNIVEAIRQYYFASSNLSLQLKAALQAAEDLEYEEQQS